MEASDSWENSWENEDKRLKLSVPEEEIIFVSYDDDYPMCASAMCAAAMEASGSEEHEDERWSLGKEMSEVLDCSVKLSFPDEETIKVNASDEGQPHDYECLNALTIWTKLRQKYSHIKVPKDIGEEIMKNFLKLAGDRIQKASVHDFGVVAFSLSQRLLAKSIHKMLKDGIQTPRLSVGKVMVDFPSLVEEINLGWFRQHAIANTLIRMLCYCKVEVTFWPSYGDEFMARCPQLRREYGKSIVTTHRERDVVINVEKKPPFILTKGDFNTFDRDLKALGYGIGVIKADWIVYLTPVWQQEYIEMCFTAAKLEGWIKYTEGKWDPRDVLEYPELTYAGYRTYGTEEWPNWPELKDHCDVVALGEDAQLLGYDGQAVLTCVFMYTCLKNHRLADCTFNSNEMVKEEGNTFVYLLHRRAEVYRITYNSRKDIDELKASDLILEKYEGWEESGERMLVFHLLAFTNVLKEASLFVLPHLMCDYLYDLSKMFKSYNDFVLRTGSGSGSAAETSRLLMCEATAVVMEKCFHLLGITPEVTVTTNLPMLRKASRFQLRSFVNIPVDVCAPMVVEVGVEPQKMAERELRDGTRLDPDFVEYFITPCVVSDARDPSRNSRFEIFAIRPIIADDKHTEGYLFGSISISDKYGSVESDVSLFSHEWSDPVTFDTRHAGLVYLDNPSSHHSLPFSSSVELHMELYASTETKDECFQLCDYVLKVDVQDFWKEKSDGKCCRSYAEGVDGMIGLYYILLKDAVDASLQVKFDMVTDREIYGDIFAFYGDEFSHHPDPMIRSYYFANLFSSYPPTSGLIDIPVLKKSGPISLRRSVLAVPKNASLTIRAYFVDAETERIILHARHNFKTPTEEDGSDRFATAVMRGKDGCELELKVFWK